MSVVKFLARPWHSFALHRQEASDPWQPFAIYCHHACCKNGKSDWCWGYRDIQAAFHAEKFHANWLVLLPEKQGCLACIVVAIYEFWLRTEMHCTLAVQRCPSSQKRLRNCPKKIDNNFFYHRSTTWKWCFPPRRYNLKLYGPGPPSFGKHCYVHLPFCWCTLIRMTLFCTVFIILPQIVTGDVQI